MAVLEGVALLFWEWKEWGCGAPLFALGDQVWEQAEWPRNGDGWYSWEGLEERGRQALRVAELEAAAAAAEVGCWTVLELHLVAVGG